MNILSEEHVDLEALRDCLIDSELTFGIHIENTKIENKLDFITLVEDKYRWPSQFAWDVADALFDQHYTFAEAFTMATKMATTKHYDPTIYTYQRLTVERRTDD